MINPISSVHPVQSHEPSAPPVPKPEFPAWTPKSGELSHDQVTLRSAGEVDHDRDE